MQSKIPKPKLATPKLGKAMRVRTQGKRATAPKVKLPTTKGVKVKVR